MAGTGEPLVLLNGFGLNTQEWDGQFSVFAEKYQVIRYDHRGAGKSEPSMSGKQHGPHGDLRALLRFFDISQAHLVGHSMGGRIAINFTLAYPECVRSLILASASIDGIEWASESDNEKAKAVLGAYQAGNVQSALDLWFEHAICKHLANKEDLKFRLRQIWAETGWDLTPSARRAPNGESEQSPQVDVPPQTPAAQRLNEIEVPTLVLTGTLDVPGLVDVANHLESHIKNARKVVLDGVGHMLNMEDPAQFNAAVLSFLMEV